MCSLFYIAGQQLAQIVTRDVPEGFEPAPFRSSSYRPCETTQILPNVNIEVSRRAVKTTRCYTPKDTRSGARLSRKSAHVFWGSAAMQTFFGVEVTPAKVTPFVPPPVEAHLHISQVRPDHSHSLLTSERWALAAPHSNCEHLKRCQALGLGLYLLITRHMRNILSGLDGAVLYVA